MYNYIYKFYIYIYIHNFICHLFVYGQLDCLYILAIANNAAMKMKVQRSLQDIDFISFR